MAQDLVTIDNRVLKIVFFVDGSLFRIQRPSHSNDAFYCGRKSFDGINALVITDRFGNIRRVVSNMPGASHDANAISWDSGFITYLDGLPDDYYVLADAGYVGVHPKIIVPFKGRNLPEDKERFNLRLTSLRQVVERSLLAFENQWRIFQAKENRIPAKNNTDFASSCIVAASVLHNRYTNFL
jgi:hypothetical protein